MVNLPSSPLPLDIRFQLPADAFYRIARGYESAGQDDKWSTYFSHPWLEIWRPNSDGWYCYAIRFESDSKGGFAVAESWIGEEIRSDINGLGGDLARHRDIVTWLLIGLGGHDPTAFQHEVVRGRVEADSVTFSGSVKSLSDVELVAEILRAHMIRLKARA